MSELLSVAIEVNRVDKNSTYENVILAANQIMKVWYPEFDLSNITSQLAVYIFWFLQYIYDNWPASVYV